MGISKAHRKKNPSKKPKNCHGAVNPKWKLVTSESSWSCCPPESMQTEGTSAAAMRAPRLANMYMTALESDLPPPATSWGQMTTEKALPYMITIRAEDISIQAAQSLRRHSTAPGMRWTSRLNYQLSKRYLTLWYNGKAAQQIVQGPIDFVDRDTNWMSALPSFNHKCRRHQIRFVIECHWRTPNADAQRLLCSPRIETYYPEMPLPAPFGVFFRYCIGQYRPGTAPIDTLMSGNAFRIMKEPFDNFASPEILLKGDPYRYLLCIGPHFGFMELRTGDSRRNEFKPSTFKKRLDIMSWEDGVRYRVEHHVIRAVTLEEQVMSMQRILNYDIDSQSMCTDFELEDYVRVQSEMHGKLTTLVEGIEDDQLKSKIPNRDAAVSTWIDHIEESAPVDTKLRSLARRRQSNMTDEGIDISADAHSDSPVDHDMEDDSLDKEDIFPNILAAAFLDQTRFNNLRDTTSASKDILQSKGIRALRDISAKHKVSASTNFPQNTQISNVNHASSTRASDMEHSEPDLDHDIDSIADSDGLRTPRPGSPLAQVYRINSPSADDGKVRLPLRFKDDAEVAATIIYEPEEPVSALLNRR